MKIAQTLKPLKIWGVVLVATTLAVSSCSEAWNAEPASGTADMDSTWAAKHVDAKSAHDVLQAEPDTRVLDIRTPGEIEGGYIKDAIFVDYQDADFAQQLTKLDRNTPYIVHCKGGGRSTKALTTLKELSFTNITHMDGGLDEWKEAGLPLVTP